MYFALAYNGAKIAKQCKHCTKLELISDFYQTRFELMLVQEISNLFPKFLPKLRFEWQYMYSA